MKLFLWTLKISLVIFLIFFALVGIHLGTAILTATLLPQTISEVSRALLAYVASAASFVLGAFLVLKHSQPYADRQLAIAKSLGAPAAC